MPVRTTTVGLRARSLFTLASAGLFALSIGCGSDEPPDDCNAGSACECTSTLDCPTGETCQAVGAAMVCLPGTVDPDAGTDGGTDVGSDADVEPDAVGVCGDGTVDDGEECDDGNTDDGDGCAADCTTEAVAEACGNGTLDDGEECDDGNTEDGDGCAADCTTEEVTNPVCGDGTVDDGEECDDGNTEDGDGCDAECKVESVCGNGILDSGEECDDGNNDEGDGCDAACFLEPTDPFCGDGFLDEGEECDDGNNTPDDGCDADCATETSRYDGWVAYITTGGGGALERVEVIAGDRSEGPYEVPVEGDFSSAKYPAFSPDGTQLYYSLAQLGEPAIRVLTLADGTREDLVSTGFTALRFPRVSPDGSMLLFSAKVESTPNVWNMYSVPIDGSAAPTALTSVTEENRTTRFVSAGNWSCDGTEIYYIEGVPRSDVSEGSSDLWVMDADGTNGTQITVGQSTTSIMPAVNRDCTELLVDSSALGQPVRVDLETAVPTPIGIAGADSNCSYYGSTDYVVCERSSGPAPAFTPCTVGGSDCVRDIVVLDLETGDAQINITQTIDRRDTFPTVSSQAYTELPLAAP